MSKDKIEEMTKEEIAKYNEEYLAWYNEQERLDLEADDEAYLRWYLETRQKEYARPHASKELPAKVGMRKAALYEDGIDKKFAKQLGEYKRIMKLVRRAEVLASNAEAEFQNGNVERAEELLNQSEAVEDRIDTDKPWEKWQDVRGKQRKALQAKQVQAEQAFDAETLATWGQEPGEFATLADKEAFEKRSAAAKKGAVTRKANQEKRDQEYLAWYNEVSADKGGKSK